MLQIKNLSAIAFLAIAGLLLLSFPVFAHGGNSGGRHCSNYTINTDRLSKEQVKKIDEIQDNYNEKTLPLRQKLNLLKTEAYNYNLNTNVDIEKVKDYRNQIRDVEGKIDDLRINETAEINKVLPEDQQVSFNGLLNQYEDNSNFAMMNNCGMMGSGMMGNSNMMNMMGNNTQSGMMNGTTETTNNTNHNSHHIKK